MVDVELPASGAAVPEGIDASGITSWFADHVPQVAAPLHFSLIAGGRSNLTYEVTDAAGRRFALRRPPVSHVLPTAHDMAREHQLVSALGSTEVPVPTTFGLCEDPAINGAPFYVMQFVEGHVLRSAADVEAAFTVEQRGLIGERLADTLATLHGVNPDAVGLGDLARPDGYIERQLRRWTRQYESSTAGAEWSRAGAGAGAGAGGGGGAGGGAGDRVGSANHVDPVLEVGRRLADRIPPQKETVIVHGDYRLDNAVVTSDGAVAAILDWELCTLGDPLADLGLLLVYWAEPGQGGGVLDLSATGVDGFPSRRQLVARYASASGRDVSDVGYFMAFGYWKLACVLQGVFARYQGGAAAGDRSNVQGMPELVVQLANRAASALEGWS